MKFARFKAAAIAVPLALVGCGPEPGDPSRQVVPNPYLPPIHQYLLPPMHVAKRLQADMAMIVFSGQSVSAESDAVCRI
jgi:hypothetical protein